jgi:hypothetical protein
MTTSAIPSTYTLDAETCSVIGRLAILWNQPESEVIKRAVKAAEPVLKPDVEARLVAARRLQDSVSRRGTSAEQWLETIMDARR